MYLSMNWTSSDGTSYPNCCIVISSIIVLPDTTMLSTNWQPSKMDDDEGKIPIYQKAFAIATSDLDNKPIYAFAYEHLLSLPEFSGAVLTFDNN